MTRSDKCASNWWDWRLFGLWVLVNAVAFAVIPLVGVLLEETASKANHNLVADHRYLVVLITAVIGSGLQGVVVGLWQWRLLRERAPRLSRGRWVVATVVPAFVLWLLVIAPDAVDLLARGGNTAGVFRDGFVQAIVLGPLIGVAQAIALRGHTRRWAWWLVANVTGYLTGAALHQFGVWLEHELSLPARGPAFFPVLAFAIHGTWMLWVTAPQATTGSAAPAPTADGGDEAHRPGGPRQ